MMELLKMTMMKWLVVVLNLLGCACIGMVVVVLHSLLLVDALIEVC